jgi:hypothetical protein
VQVCWRGLTALFPVTYYLFTTNTLCYRRGIAAMTRSLLVYDSLCTRSTISTSCLDYNPSQDRLQLDAFIDCSSTSSYLLNARTQGLAPPFCYDYFMLTIWLLARGFDATRHSACFNRQLSCFNTGCCKFLDNTRSLSKIYLGEIFINHYFRDVIPK